MVRLPDCVFVTTCYFPFHVLALDIAQYDCHDIDHFAAPSLKKQSSITLGLPPDAPGMREVTPVKTLEKLATLWDVGADYDAGVSR